MQSTIFNSRWAPFLLVFFLVFGLLSIHMGFGLVIGLILYTIGNKAFRVYEKILRPKPAIVATSLTIIGSLAILITALSSGIRYSIKLYQTQSTQFLEYILLALQDIKQFLPKGLSKHVPKTIEEFSTWGEQIGGFLGQHGLSMGGAGIILMFQLLFATLIAISCSTAKWESEGSTPFLTHLKDVYRDYTICFSKLMGAQVYVAFWNALCTMVFVYLILPMVGVTLSFREILVVFTLVISLIPALGNMIANAVMAMLCLPHGAFVLLAAVVFLIVVHKAEYIINAKIIGKTVEASVPEMLLAILIGERLFGLPGLMLGPVTYAFLKMHLKKMNIL